MIPERYKKVEYKDTPKNLQKALEAMRESRRGLYIWGGVGTGKTHALYGLYKGAKKIYGDVAPMAFNATQLMNEIRGDFDRKRVYVEYEDVLFRINRHKGILMIDDLGSEKMSDWVAETFYLIVNDRYERMLPIIFTSNLSVDEVASRVGDRIASRIVEMCDIVQLDGKDRRLETYKSLKA